MRAIKFRAWDNVKNAMYYPGEEDLMLFMLADEGFRVDEVIPDDSNSEGFYAERLEHLQFMQFTGLHDKNGVEIYEGDILKESSTHPLVVFIKEGHTQIRFKDFDVPCEEFIYQSDIDDMDIAVFGNIYENPNLLENSK